MWCLGVWSMSCLWWYCGEEYDYDCIKSWYVLWVVEKVLLWGFFEF